MRSLRLPLLILILFCAAGSLSAVPLVVQASNQHQEGATGKLAELPFIVVVSQPDGKPVVGAKVESTCINVDGAAKLLDPLVRTDSNGRAAIRFVNGDSIRQYRIVTKVYAPDIHEPSETVIFTSMAISLKDILLFVLGGLAIFLFGMKLLSDGLQGAAGDRMKSILEFLSRNKYMGVVVGFIVTSILQSSSITTVMLVGFVNAGIMTLKQTIGIIMGANIGTTVTGFIISIKVEELTYPICILGYLLSILPRSRKWQFFGQVLFGLGLVFIGLQTMSANVKPLKDSVTISNAFINFSVNPMMAVLAGLVVTFLVQSSSATLGLIITLGLSGLIDIRGAFGLVLGSNIGTTITAQLAAIGGNSGARRLAMVHTLFNVFGSLVMIVLMEARLLRPFFDGIGHTVGLFSGKAVMPYAVDTRLLVPTEYMAFYIATMHAVFNIFTTIYMLPLAGMLERLAVFLIKIRKGEEKTFALEPHLLATPALALEQTREQLRKMLVTARKMLELSTSSLFEEKNISLKKLEKRENRVDSMQREITDYLVKLLKRQISDEEATLIPKLIHAVNDVERIGDISENIMESAIACRDDKIKFSKQAEKDIVRMQRLVAEMVDESLVALHHGDRAAAQRVVEKERLLNKLEIDSRAAHVKRLKEGSCHSLAGIHFLDILSNLERIGDHLNNVADVVLSS